MAVRAFQLDKLLARFIPAKLLIDSRILRPGYRLNFGGGALSVVKWY